MRDLKLTHLPGRFAEEKFDSNPGVNLDPADPTPLFVCPVLLLVLAVPAHPRYLSNPSSLEFETLLK